MANTVPLPYGAKRKQIIDRLNEMYSIGNIDIYGTALWARQYYTGYITPLLAKITNTGPVGDEDDYTDYRYWISVICNSTTTSQWIDSDGVTLVPFASPQIFTAYNLSEYTSGSHTLSVGQIVLINPISDMDVPSVPSDTGVGTSAGPRWFISSIPTPTAQYQVFVASTDTTFAWDQVRAHP